MSRKVRFEECATDLAEPTFWKDWKVSDNSDGFFGSMDIEDGELPAVARAHFQGKYGRVGTELLTNGSLFNWTRNSLVYETMEGMSAYEYPFSKEVWHHPASRAGREGHAVEELKDLLQKCLDSVDLNLGNIAPIIAADLSLPIAEHERELLPKTDPIHPYWQIGSDCKAMVCSKIPIAQKEYAHQLFLDGNVDILLTWRMTAQAFELNSAMHSDRTIMLTPAQHRIWTQAAQAAYKAYPLIRDVDVESSADGERLETGGYYAVIPRSLYSELAALVEQFGSKFSLRVVVEPKPLGSDEEAEISQYHASRRIESKAMVEKRRIEQEEEARNAEQAAHERRKEDTYQAAVERSREIATNVKYDWRMGDKADSEKKNEERWFKMTGGWYD